MKISYNDAMQFVNCFGVMVLVVLALVVLWAGSRKRYAQMRPDAPQGEADYRELPEYEEQPQPKEDPALTEAIKRSEAINHAAAQLWQTEADRVREQMRQTARNIELRQYMTETRVVMPPEGRE